MGLPNRSTTRTTHVKNLLLSQLPPTTCKGEIEPFQQPLTSIPQLCKNGFVVTFDDAKITFYTNTGRPILAGNFFLEKRLYLIQIDKTTTPSTFPTSNPNFVANAQISTLDRKKIGNLVSQNLLQSGDIDMDTRN